VQCFCALLLAGLPDRSGLGAMLGLAASKFARVELLCTKESLINNNEGSSEPEATFSVI